MATTIDQLDAKIDKLFQAVLETNKQVMEIGITLKNTVNDVEEAKKSRTKIYDKLDQYRDEIEELKHRPEKEAYEREKDNKYVNSNYDLLSEKFTNKFIAVKNQEIIASGTDFNKTLKDAKKKGDLSLVVIKFIFRKGQEFIL